MAEADAVDGVREASSVEADEEVAVAGTGSAEVTGKGVAEGEYGGGGPSGKFEAGSSGW